MLKLQLMPIAIVLVANRHNILILAVSVQHKLAFGTLCRPYTVDRTASYNVE